MKTFIFGCFQLQKEQKKKWHLIDSSFFCEIPANEYSWFSSEKINTRADTQSPEKKLANFIEKKKYNK